MTVQLMDGAGPETRGWYLKAATAMLGVVVGSTSAGQLPVVGPQIRIDPLGGTAAANETTASASDANPGVIVAGWNDWRRSGGSELINSGFSISFDGGQTWADFLLRPPAPNQSGVEGDPMTAFDPRTGNLWAGAISFSAGSNSGIYVARKEPTDLNFRPAVMARQAGGTDKCWMAAGPRPGEPDSTRLYVTYNEGVIWSDDMGDTWTSPNFIDFGIGFLPRVAPDGTLYVAYWDLGTGMNLARSTNGGQSFVIRTIATRMDVWGTQDGSRFPGTFRVPSMCYLDVDENTGRLYAAYFDTTNIINGQRNVDIYFTYSDDEGDSWTTPTILNNDGVPPGDQFFCWIEVDSRSRLHMVFFDSRHTDQNDNVTNGYFDAYYAYSDDEGATWAEFRLTPQSWNSNDDGLDRFNQFLGDYLGLAVAGNRAWPVYVDTSNGDPDTFTHVVELPIPADITGDGVVNVADLLALLDAWGACDDPDDCPEDLNGDGVVDVFDLLILLDAWG
jgi:hypothetical protein